MRDRLAKAALKGLGGRHQRRTVCDGVCMATGDEAGHLDQLGIAGVQACVFRSIVTDRFGIVTAEFGNVTDRFGDVTGGVLKAA